MHRESVRRGTGIFWLLAGAAAILSAALWLRSPTLPYLAAVGVATGAVAILGRRAGSSGWRLCLLAALLTFVGMGMYSQAALRRIDETWETFDAERRAEGAKALERALVQAVRDARRMERAASRTPGRIGRSSACPRRCEDRDGRARIVRYDRTAVRGAGASASRPHPARPIGYKNRLLVSTLRRGSERSGGDDLVSERPPADVSPAHRRGVVSREACADSSIGSAGDQYRGAAFRTRGRRWCGGAIH